MRTPGIFSIAALSIVGGLTLSAQTSQLQTTPRPSGDQRSGAASRGAEQTVTVTGCLQQNGMNGMSGASGAGGGYTTPRTGGSGAGSSGTMAGSGAGSAGTSGSNQSRSSEFMLTNAKMAQGSSTSALGTATHFSLTGMSNADLSKHVNHQVEVTGRLSGASMGDKGSAGGHATGAAGSTGSTGSATGSTGATGTTGTTGSTGSTAGTAGRSGGAMHSGSGMNDMPQLHATNLKMIAATCPAQ